MHDRHRRHVESSSCVAEVGHETRIFWVVRLLTRHHHSRGIRVHHNQVDALGLYERIEPLEDIRWYPAVHRVEVEPTGEGGRVNTKGPTHAPDTGDRPPVAGFPVQDQNPALLDRELPEERQAEGDRDGEEVRERALAAAG